VADEIYTMLQQIVTMILMTQVLEMTQTPQWTVTATQAPMQATE
jgi:hypothetical protein